ncbi:MAG: hypothetical protein OQL19_16415 [Gammaproteobacteria bacterium]|nr:hypothetical protein [Gammaproteobacteria bacterium]
MNYINQYNSNKQFSTVERCNINELLNNVENEDCSIARASVAPGVCTQLHAVNNTVERYVIIEGEGKVYINNKSPKNVSYLDVVIIPEGIPQKIENCGQTDLIFLCICTPRFEQKNYINLESGNSPELFNSPELINSPELANSPELVNNPKGDTLTHEENNIKAPDHYVVVSCEMHSELELAIMHGKHLKIFYDNEQIVQLKPNDVITRGKNEKKGEFLVGFDETGKRMEIRLDKIKRFITE